MDKNNIRFLAIGRPNPLPKQIQKKIKEAQRKTRDNTGLTVVLALNYGARQEIIDATKDILHAVERGVLKIEDLNEDTFSQHLYTAGLPDPDLLIRTSAELRISNFLLWQLSYAELYFPKKMWPEFRAQDFKEAIEEYQARERRFGGLSKC
jgi:undecaprenyl diphosphate synthase